MATERNANSVPSLTAKSNAADNADVILWADPSTHRLLTNSSISGGSLTTNAAAPAANNIGVLPAVANAAAPTYTEGYQVLLSTDLSGALRVTGSLSVGGTTDNSAFTAGSSTGTPAMGFYHSTIDAVTDGRSAAVAITAKRAQHVALFDTSGTFIGDATTPMQVSLANTGANATAVKVNVASGGIASGAIASGAIASGAVATGAFASGSIGSGAIASGAIASGAVASGAVASGAFASGSIAAGAVAAGATSFVKLEDVASADADAGVPAMAVRKATPANTSGTDGDYEMLQMSAGRLWASSIVGGSSATNVAIADNPINNGAQAVSSENAAVTTARQVQLVADLVGKLIVLPYANPENFVSGVTAAMTGTTSTSLVASPGGSLRNYITHIIVTNSHATVGTFVLIQDGSGGTTIYEGYCAAAGGGFSISFPTPLRQPTTATAIYVQNVTTGANTIASASGYKGL